MSHIVLLGDSIFDNERYVAGGSSVTAHLRRALPAGGQVTLLAQDGAVTADVPRQLAGMPADATHLVLSVGGNDALSHSGASLYGTAQSSAEALEQLAEVHEQFRQGYRAVLRQLVAHGKPAAVCTIYDAIPGLGRVERTGLCVFNDVILREAFRVGAAVIDLRLVCTDTDDYAASSPIEPSVAGGGKIARAISRLIAGSADGSGARSAVFA